MKRILAICLCFVFALLCGCSSEEDITAMRYRISKLPDAIDPQISSSPESLSIVRNVFEGLTRIDKNGDAVLAAAESYTLSDDGLVYTFKINDEKVWSDGRPLTAYDFEFGIKRTADPKTKSPHAAKISVIKGSTFVLARSANLNQMGVKAVDSQTLVITLNAPCPQFLSYLATEGFMPCNKEFFESTKGKYGLGRKETLYNGVYEIYRWDTENKYITLSASDTYVGDFAPQFDTVLFTASKTDNISADFNDGNLHLMAYDNKSNLERFEQSDVFSVDNTTGVLVFGNGFQNEMLSALRKSIDTSIAVKNTGLIQADGYVPPSIFVGGRSYRSSAKRFTYNYDPSAAHSDYILSLNSKEYNGSFPATTLCYLDDIQMESVAKNIAAQWQSNLGLYINITPLSKEKLTERYVTDPNCIILFSFTAHSAATDIFDEIILTGIKPTEDIADSFNNTVSDLKHNYDPETYFKGIEAAEKVLFDSVNMLPVCFTGNKYICRKELKDKLNYINGVFDFCDVQ